MRKAETSTINRKTVGSLENSGKCTKERGIFHDFQRVVDVMNDGAIERWRSAN